jgi:hypothetical protein
LLDPAGLPHREWYRHLIDAPGFKTRFQDLRERPVLGRENGS